MVTTIWILSIALVVMTVVALKVNARRKTEKYLKEHWRTELSEMTSIAMKSETELRDKLEKSTELINKQKDYIKGIESDIQILLLSRKKA